MWLPLRHFPDDEVNGVIWWFFWINVIGFFFSEVAQKESKRTGHTWADAGVSYQEEGFGLHSGKVAKPSYLP